MRSTDMVARSRIVYVNGIDSGLELLRQGLAWVYTRYLPEASADIQASYRQAEAEAREERRGLWSDPDPLPPWEWRHPDKLTSWQ
jgi:micrococcal nuclease